jgi:EAL domain-containing protein (putative c-di-GMP-specific phosphodiesterase class I)
MWVRDLESTNGTYVNGQPVGQAEMLEPDDVIAIGKHAFKVKRLDNSQVRTHQQTICETFCDAFEDFSDFEPKLRKLICSRNVLPHFQPLIRFSDMAEVGYEILGRVTDEGLPADPSELFAMAENLGYASDLSALFREVGVEIGRNLPGSPLLFVNTARLEIYEMDSLLTSLRRVRDIAPRSRVVLELNEKATVVTNALSELRSALESLDMGLAFDDFGVGQTRLLELSQISPDYLKFDISLIRQVHLAPKRLHQMIATFINASHDLCIHTLAEGVECAEEAEACRQLGFDFGQGYFFGMPQPIHGIEHNPAPTPAGALIPN